MNDLHQPTIPCELCGAPTTMLGTKRCDGCWELETRIHANPKLAAQILADMQETGVGEEVMRLAHTIDVGCWVSYSGQPKQFKRFMEKRRQAAIAEARKQIERGE